MRFVNEAHLGGYVASDAQYPNGDPMTYCPEVWKYLLYRFLPEIVVDVGCGEGHAVKWFNDRRVELNTNDPAQDVLRNLYSFHKRELRGVSGYEGCQTAIDNGVAPGLVTQHDFSTNPATAGYLMLHPGYKYMIWSCEFVEHVEEKHVENFLRVFAQAEVVAMTHAFPGQPGHHHVNCQMQQYWVDKMTEKGFEPHQVAIHETRLLGKGTHWERSGLVFVKKEAI